MTKPLFIMHVSDAGALHMVELTKIADGRGVGTMLDHDDAQIEAFVTFGAEPPECFTVLKLWRENPLNCLLRFGQFDHRKLVALCFDWIDAVWDYIKVANKEIIGATARALAYARRLFHADVVQPADVKRLHRFYDDLMPFRDALYHGFYEDEDAAEGHEPLDVPHEEAVRASSVVMATMSLCSPVLTEYFHLLGLQQRFNKPGLSRTQEDDLAERISNDELDLQWAVANVAHEAVSAEVPYYMVGEDEDEEPESWEDLSELRSKLRARQTKDVLKVMKEHKRRTQSLEAALVEALFGDKK
jgi:hypothetical protein